MYPTPATKYDDEESSELDHVSECAPLTNSTDEKKKIEVVEDLDFDDLPILTHPTAIKSRRARFLQHVKTVFKHLCIFLPSFLDPTSTRPQKLHASAWLDGLRGIAAWFVVLHHSSLVWFSWDIHQAWKGSFTENSWMIRLPIIRLLLSGPPQVMIFFVVSGYAISHKPLKLARQGHYSEVGAALSSGVFRRHPRLFMPAAFVTLCCALMTQLDASWFGSDGLPGTAVPTRVPPHAFNLISQLMNWRDVEVQVTNPVGQGFAQATNAGVYVNPYDPNLWTLPMEFSSSMVIFMFITAFTRMPSRLRMAFAVAVTFYFEYYFIYWALIPFLSGMFLCDLHFELDEIKARRSKNSNTAGPESLPMWARVQRSAFSRALSRITRSRVLGQLLGLLAFLMSLWLLSVPEAYLGGPGGWGFVTLASWVSDTYRDHVLNVLGAVCLVGVVDHASFLQVLFTNRFSQYMGRISYSLYLVHGPLLWSFGIKTAHFGLRITGWKDDVHYTAGIFIAACLWWPVAIVASDFTTRFVDEVSVRFTRWVYERLVRKE